MCQRTLGLKRCGFLVMCAWRSRSSYYVSGGGVWFFRSVCCERVVLSSPGCLWPGRMDDHEEVLEAHA